MSLKVVAEQLLGSAEQVSELVVSLKFVAEQRLLSLSLKVACCELEGCCGATVIVSEQVSELVVSLKLVAEQRLWSAEQVS